MIKNILDFFKEYKDSFTSIGVLITFFVSAVSLYLSIRNNKAVHYVNSITKSRIEWIQKLRNTVAEYIASTNIYNNAYYQNDYEKMGVHLSQCQQLCSEISLLLNFSDEKDREITSLANKILDSYREYCDAVHNVEVSDDGYFNETEDMIQQKNEVENTIKILNQKIQIYLKAEWNRVKYESQGKIYEKATQKFDYEELEKKYADFSYNNDVWRRFRINSKAKFKRISSSPGYLLFFSCSVVIIICVILIA